MRLAIVTTHPIQYNAPWFKLLAEEPGIELMVFYTWEQSQSNAKYDPGFGKMVSWDIPLLEGYNHTFVKNVAEDPGSHHYKGIDNPTLNKQIKDWRPDFILVIGWPFKSHLACLKYFKGKIPILFRGDSTLLDEVPGVKKVLRRLFLRYIYNHVDHALYVGTNNKSYFLAHGVKEKRLWYVPHAIDNNRFSANASEDKEAARKWRKELGISDSQFVVLYAGKLEAKKNPEFLLKLASEINDDNFRFIIVGNGPLEAELKQNAAGNDRIIFLDFQNQQKMPVVYNLCNAFILPSSGPGETWGLALNEAMACGKPVIATNKCGGAIDLVSENGIIVDPASVSDAANYLKCISKKEKMYKDACDASTNTIQHFSFRQIVNNIVKTLNSIDHGKK